ncbi:MAG TPA: isoamylase early set domain-containing protein [Gemmatimonadales bacterium]|nr:isoamylase early set domain-containing protein [Gemmatimonadales bacterium]
MTDQPDEPAGDSKLGLAIAELRRPVKLPGDPVNRTLERLARDSRHRWQTPLLAGLGIAATFALLVLSHQDRQPPSRGRAVRFALQSQAQQVALIGDFNDWDPSATPLTRQGGEWSATVALKPGRYRYAFLVNGNQLEADPAGPAATDEFGGPASAVTVAN